jgi:8-oxo-dGTP diphosphatase
VEAAAKAQPRGLGLSALLLVIRHARAGHRTQWEGDDRRRPLDERGHAQSKKLVLELEGFAIERILSSPYDRCVQTVEPLAAARGLDVELREELSEERQGTDGVVLVRELVGEPVALCVHGGLSDWTLGVRQKKAEILVVDAQGGVVESRRV